MKGLYTLEKPKSSRDLYVAEVLIQRVGCGSSPDEGLGVACCNDYNGLDMIVDGHYSPFLKQYMSKEVFQQIEQDVNGDLEYAKEKVKKGRQALQSSMCCRGPYTSSRSSFGRSNYGGYLPEKFSR